MKPQNANWFTTYVGSLFTVFAQNTVFILVGILCFMGVLAGVALTLCRLEDNKSRRIFIVNNLVKVQQFNASRSAAQREDLLRNQKRHQEDLINQIFPRKIARQLISKIAQKSNSNAQNGGRASTWKEFKFLKSAGQNAAEIHKGMFVSRTYLLLLSFSSTCGGCLLCMPNNNIIHNRCYDCFHRHCRLHQDVQ